MQVFISWSGAASAQIAVSLKTWIPNVIQAAETWMSEKDLESGERWNEIISAEMKATRVGIFCVTPDNTGSPWILFEAGAVSNATDKAYVCPYLFQLQPTDLKFPLAQFQAKRSDKEGTHDLIRTINKALDPLGRIAESQLDATFEKWWPDLEKDLHKVRVGEAPPPRREVDDMVEEILTIVRSISNKSNEAAFLRSLGSMAATPEPTLTLLGASSVLRSHGLMAESIKPVTPLGDTSVLRSPGSIPAPSGTLLTAAGLPIPFDNVARVVVENGNSNSLK